MVKGASRVDYDFSWRQQKHTKIRKKAEGEVWRGGKARPEVHTQYIFAMDRVCDCQRTEVYKLASTTTKCV